MDFHSSQLCDRKPYGYSKDVQASNEIQNSIHSKWLFMCDHSLHGVAARGPGESFQNFEGK